MKNTHKIKAAAIGLICAAISVNVSAFADSGADFGKSADGTVYTRDFNFGLDDIKQAVGDTNYERYLNKKAELPNEIPVFKPYEPEGEIKLYVSVDGDNKNPGTLEKPFKTVQHAVNYVKKIGDRSKGVVIYIRGGSYDMSDGLVIPESVSGVDGKPVIISNYNNEKVNFIGGISVAGNNLKIADDEKSRKKLPESVQGKIYSVNLKDLGITDYGTINESGPPKLLADGVEYTLARYPNATNIGMKKYEGADGENGVIRTGPITDSGSELGPPTGDTGEGFEFTISDTRPFEWENTGDIWMYGSWYAEWLKEYVNVRSFNKDKMSVSTIQHTKYGSKYAKDTEHYYFNVMEELDSPGEWYIDRQTGMLYIYPIGDNPNELNISITTSKKDIVTFENCQNVVLNGITVESGGNNGIKIQGKKNVVQNCEIYDVVNFGVLMYSANCGVISSTIARTGNFAVDIHIRSDARGVNETSYLTPTRNFVQNCYIYNVLRGVYNSGGVQNIISHNCVMNTRAMGINIGSGNETIVEYNEVEGGPNVNYDSAQLYVNGNGMSKGTVVRYNYFHDSLVNEKDSDHTHCMYFDDRSSGCYAYSNILKGGGLFSHGGSDNVFENNIIIDVQPNQLVLANSANYYLRSEDRWAGWVVKSGSVWHGVTRSSSIYNQAWWSRYPDFYDWAVDLNKHQINYESENHVRDELEDYLRMPRYTVIKDNIMVNTDDYTKKKPEVEYEVEYTDNIMYKTDPGFVDYKNQVYDLKEDSKIYKDCPGFTTLPKQSKMGVIIDDELLTKVPSMNDVMPITPENNEQSKVLNTNIILKWTQSFGSNGYIVEVASDNEFKNIVYTTKTAHPQAEVPELEYGKTYYWKVTPYTKAQCMNKEVNTMKTAQFTTYTLNEAYKYLVPDTYSFEQAIKDAKDFNNSFYEENEVEGEPGAYKQGTKEKINQCILLGEKAVQTEKLQARLDIKQNQMKQDIIKILTDNAIEHSRSITEFDGKDWLNSNQLKSTVSFAEDKSSLTVSSSANFIMYYNKTLSPKEENNIAVKYEQLNNWTAICIKQTEAGVSSPTQTNGYFVVIKADSFELQKIPKRDGASDAIIATAENNGKIKGGEFYNITTLAENVDGGVKIVFKVNGETIFDYLDTDNPLYDLGCFAFMHNAGNGSMTVTAPINK